jgi:ferredoxin
MIWTRVRIRVDMTKCDGRGLCAELAPERITLDDWGFPIIDPTPVHGRVKRHARRAVAGCPELALFLERASEDERAGR